MVGLPKKKISSAVRGSRRAHNHLKLAQLMTCPQCKVKKVTHQVCHNCGTYNGMDILHLDDKAKRRPE